MYNYLKGKVKNLTTKMLITILLISCLIFSFSISKILTAQENDRIKYFKKVDKTHYYTRFVNEIPYFLINRYDFYYQVVYRKNEDKIKEVSVFDKEKEIEKWLYKYPQPEIVEINYNKVELPKPSENEPSEGVNNNDNYSVLGEEIRTILTPIEKDVFYYEMGKLVKGENYTAENKLNYYFNIKYKGNKIDSQYYYNSNDSYVYKFFNYDKDNNLSYVLRRGIIKKIKMNDWIDESKENLLTITEKWLYNNHKLDSIEKYEGTSLKEKLYYNEYGIITKKEIFNNVLRITHFYIYEYDKDLNLVNVKKYKTLDPFRSIPNECVLLEEYLIEKNIKLIEKIYSNNSLVEEQFVNYPDKIITQINYSENGDITDIEYVNIINEINHKFYSEEESSKLLRETKINIHNKIRQDIEYDDEGNISNKKIEKIEKDKYFLDKDYNPLESTKDNPKIVINFIDEIVTEVHYDDEGKIEKRLKSKVISDFDNYLARLKLQPNKEIILFAPDSQHTFTREN